MSLPNTGRVVNLVLQIVPESPPCRESGVVPVVRRDRSVGVRYLQCPRLHPCQTFVVGRTFGIRGPLCLPGSVLPFPEVPDVWSRSSPADLYPVPSLLILLSFTVPEICGSGASFTSVLPLCYLLSFPPPSLSSFPRSFYYFSFVVGYFWG